VRSIDRILDRPWPLIMAAAALVAAALYWSSRPDTHTVRVAFSAALNVTEGADVQSSGVRVGQAKNVRYEDGRAVMDLNLTDEVWPLPRGTTAKIRLSSISGNVNRRIELVLGPRGAPALREGSVIGAEEPKPVELDEILNTFDAPTRETLQKALANTAEAIGGHTKQLNDGVGELSNAVPAVGELMTDLHATDRYLSSLVRNGDRVTRLLATRRQRVGDIVELADTTFSTFAQHSRQMQRTLDETPPALRQVTATTRRLSGALVTLTALMHDLRPTARELVPTARVLAPTLALLRPTAREAADLVGNVTRSAPSITRFLERATPFTQDAASIVKELTPIVTCLRPYAPELAGTLTNWSSWTANYDANGNIGRIFPDVAGVGSLADSPDVKATDFDKFGMKYAALRAPGWIAGAPSYDDSCGVGKAGVDPSNEWPDNDR